MSLSGQRVLVIGGAGFIGSFVVKELLKEDVAEVVIFDSFTRGTHDNIASVSARLTRAGSAARVWTTSRPFSRPQRLG